MSYSGKSCSSARARMARSRAEVICSSAGRPFGLTQLDWVMPRFLLVAVHLVGELLDRAADAFGQHDRHVVGRLHHQHLERVVDGDLGAGLEADLGRRLRGGASRETVNSVSSVRRLFLTACSVTYMVISLEVEAGYHGIVAFSACSTLPVSASTSSVASVPARARGGCGENCGGEGRGESLESERRHKCHWRGPVCCLRASGRVLFHSMFGISKP